MERPLSWRVWLIAARIRTLGAAFAPVLVGSALAFKDQQGHWTAAFAALIGALLIQIGTNYANDYYDFKQGADTAQRVGPLRVMQAGWVSPTQMRRAIIITFGLAILVGVYLVVRAGWPVVIIGLSGILFGWLYTAGPLPLAYYGLGDLFAFLYFGPVAVVGTYYVQALRWSDTALVMGLVEGAFAVALLTANNLRDLEEDRTTGKGTLPVRFGRVFGRLEYLGCWLLAAAAPWWLAWQGRGPWTQGMAVLAQVFYWRVLWIILRETQPQKLLPALAGTGRMQVVYSILFTLGLWI